MAHYHSGQVTYCVVLPVVGGGEEDVVEPERWVDERNLYPLLP